MRLPTGRRRSDAAIDREGARRPPSSPGGGRCQSRRSPHRGPSPPPRIARRRCRFPIRCRRHGGGRRGRRPAVLPLASVSLEGAFSSWPRAGGIVGPAFRRDAVVERAPVGLCPSIARSRTRPGAPPLGEQRTALDRADRTDQASDGVDAPRHVGFLRERTLPLRPIGVSWPPGHRAVIRAVEGGAVDMEP